MNKPNSKTKPRFFFLVGEKSNWETSINGSVWGFSEKKEGYWNSIKKDEYLGYYVTAPVKKIIGFGKVKRKFMNDELIWRDEKQFKQSIWKYKIGLKHLYVCEDWNDGIDIDYARITLRSTRPVIDKKIFLEYVKKADSKWHTKLTQEIK